MMTTKQEGTPNNDGNGNGKRVTFIGIEYQPSHGNSSRTQSPGSDTASEQSSYGKDGESYTVFTLGQRHLILFLISFGGAFSALTAFVYLPALIDLSHTLSVSLELMNVTVTGYLVVQGLVPSILADLSDHQGRRPVYLAALLIFCGASLGLAFQTSYAALLILRMVQSAGAAGTIALAYGVIGDIIPPHERGFHMGVAQLGWFAMPSLRPVIGGIITHYLGWRWVFRMLAILSGITMVVFFIAFPETSRNLVGNGNRLARGINQSPLLYFQQKRATKSRPTSIAVLAPFSAQLQQYQHRHPLRIPNPLACLKLVFRKSAFLVLLANAIFYLQYSCLQVSLATLLQTRYNLTPLQSGVCYLAYAVPSAVASFVAGKIINHDYITTARQHNITVERTKGDKMITFPIENARLRSVWFYILIAAAATTVYGWAIQERWHLAVVLTMQALSGLSITAAFIVCITLMMDLHADDPTTTTMQASAALSITSCLAAAGGVGVLDILLRKLGEGWTFSIIGGLCLATLVPLGVLNIKGWGWRKKNARKAGYRSKSSSKKQVLAEEV